MKHLSLSATNGLYAAVLNFALVLAMYLIDINLMVEWWASILALGLIVVFMFVGTSAVRRAGDGFMTFGQTWLHAMAIAVIAQLVSVVLTLVLYHVIDPELPSIMMDLTLEKTRSFMEGMGLSGDLLDAQMEQTAVAMKEAFTVGGMFKNSLWGMIMWAFVSLIVAAINKRNRPSEFA